MRLLLLLFFFVSGTKSYTVTLTNNCATSIKIERWAGEWAPGPVINLASQQKTSESIAVNEEADFYVFKLSLAKFFPAASQRTNFTLATDVYPIGQTLLKPACASGQPCPGFRCGLLPTSNYSCKKDGDANFSDEVLGSRPNTMNYYITYCAAP